MPICIAGMHRSGTSMVSRLNNLCGLYLGPESELSAPAWDNKEGFWENVHFVEMNDKILAQFDAGWDLPPTLLGNWRLRPEIGKLQTEAADLIDRFISHEPWGWKDPRNSLTLPFWTDLIPNLKVLICVRNPLEVAQSLHARNFSSTAFGLRLWVLYNQSLLSSVRPEHRIVTHYDSYFHNPEAELRRILELLSIPASDGDVDLARQAASSGLRHQQVAIEDLSLKLPPDILKLYLELCARAGPVYRAFHQEQGGDLDQQLFEANQILQELSWASADLGSQRSHWKHPIVTARDQTIVNLTQSLRAQADLTDKALCERDEAALLFEEEISGLNDALSRSEEDCRQAARLNAELGSQVEALTKSATEVAIQREREERKNEILSAQLSAKTAEVARISTSLGWKLLSRYGPFKYRHLLPLYRLLRLPPYQRTPATDNGVLRLPLASHSAQRAAWPALQSPAEVPEPFGQLPVGEIVPRPLESNLFDVICFPIIDWDFRFQRPQQLMSRFADAGHRVFYVSAASYSSGPPYTIQKKRNNVYEVALRGFEQVVYADLMGEKERDFLFDSLEELRQDLLLGATVAFAQLPFWWPLVSKTRAQFAWPIVYDCMDHHAGFSTNKKAMVDQEEHLLAGADMVVATSAVLQELAAKHNANVLLVPNACDYEHFAQAHGSRSERSVIGYYGAIADWFDSDLVADLAERRPDWDFVLVGSTFSADVRRLSKLPNVSLPGEKHYAEIPDWLGQFDVAIIPFKRSALTEATNPVKAYEILASGKPLVSVPIPEMAALAPLVRLASTAEEFEKEVSEALTEDQPALVQDRRVFAAENTWEKRYEALAPVVRTIFPRASIIVVTFNNLQLNRLCLESIFGRTEWPDFEVIVVDNNSTDGTPEYLREAEKTFPNLQVILNEDNLGFAAGNNIGLQRATGDYLVLLNNDTVVTRGWLSTLIRHLHRDREIGLIGPVTNSIGNEAKVDVDYVILDDMPAWAADFVQQHAGMVFEIPMLAMFCVAMRREVFEKVGPLDEQFGLGLFEDDDYTLRMKAEGLRVVCAADAFVHHFGQASFKKLVETGEYQGLFDKNRRRFEQKWGLQWTPHQSASVELKRTHTERAALQSAIRDLRTNTEGT